MSEAAIPLVAHVRVLEAGLQMEASRSGGPGGQHANTSATAVQLRLPLWALIGLDEAARQRLRRLAGQRLTLGEELLLRCDRERSQARNRELAWQRLRDLVAAALRAPRPRKRTRPTRGSVERRLQAKKQRAAVKRRRRVEPDDEQ